MRVAAPSDRALISSREAGRAGAVPRLDRWVAGAILLGLGLRLFRLDAAPLWLDEVATWSLMRRPWRTLLDGTFALQRPLYYVIERGWTGAFGLSPEIMRLPGVLYGTLAILVVAAAVWRLFGAWPGRVAAALAAISPYLVQHAQEAREYALLSLLAAVSLYLLVGFLSGGRRLGAGFLVVALLMIATQPFSVALLAAEAGALALVARDRWRDWAPAMVLLLLVGGADVVLLGRMNGAERAPRNDFGLAGLPGIGWTQVAGYALVPGSDEYHAGGLRSVLPYLPPALLGAAAAGTLAYSAFRRMDRRLFLALGLPVLLVPVLIVGAHLVSPQSPVNPRYAMSATPLLILILAFGTTNAWGGGGLQRAAVVVLILEMLAGTALHLSLPGHGREDVLAARQWIDQHSSPSEPVLAGSGAIKALAAYHWQPRTTISYPPEGTVVSSQAQARELVARLPLDGQGRAIYAVSRGWEVDPEGYFLGDLLTSLKSCGTLQVRAIQLVCVTR